MEREATIEAARKYIEDRVSIDPNCGCWLWLPSLGSHGYGNAAFKALTGVSVTTAHSLSYLVFIGVVPNGLQIDHLCRVRSCCNPNHLEAVLPLVNQWRRLGIKMMATENQCPRGHGEYRRTAKRAVCPQCHRDRNIKYSQKLAS